MAKIDNLKIDLDNEVLKMLLGRIAELESRIQILELKQPKIYNQTTLFAHSAQDTIPPSFSAERSQ